MFGKQSYGNEYLRDMKELKEEMENRLITKSSIASRRGVSSIAVLHDRLRRGIISLNFTANIPEGETSVYDYIDSAIELKRFSAIEKSIDTRTDNFTMTVENLLEYFNENTILIDSRINSGHIKLICEIFERHYNTKFDYSMDTNFEVKVFKEGSNQ